MNSIVPDYGKVFTDHAHNLASLLGLRRVSENKPVGEGFRTVAFYLGNKILRVTVTLESRS